MPFVKQPYPQFQRGQLVSDRLIAAWQLSERAGIKFYDSSQSNNTGTMNNASGATFTGGPFGGLVNFSGTTAFINCGAVFEPGTASYSIVGFGATTVNDATLLRRDPGGGAGRSLIILDMAGSFIRFYQSTAASSIVNLTSAASYNDGKMHCYIGVRDKDAGASYLFADGKKIGSGGDPGDLTSAAGEPYIIGAYAPGGVFSSNPWNGPIDSVRLYARALSVNEVNLISAGLG